MTGPTIPRRRAAQRRPTAAAAALRLALGRALAVALMMPLTMTLTGTTPLPGQTAPPPRPSLRTSLDGMAEPVSTDGTLRLTWAVDRAPAAEAEVGAPPSPQPRAEPLTYEIEEQHDTGGRALIDAGAQHAAALSGRDDGRYRFRVRAVTATGARGPWSEPVEVRVAHHPLWLSLTVFGVGAAVFLGTVVLVLAGRRSTRTDAATPPEERE